MNNNINLSVDYLLVNNSERSNYRTDYIALEKALDNAKSLDGKPMTAHDRKIIRSILMEYFTYKY